MEMNEKSYRALIQEDIDWLENNTEDTLEREHIIKVLKDSIVYLYPKTEEKIEEEAREKQYIIENYVLTPSQVEWIKSDLSEYEPQMMFFEDMIYGKPKDNCGGLVISEMKGRDDIVSIKIGEYIDGLFYYRPVVNGVFDKPKVVSEGIIGIIPLIHY